MRTVARYPVQKAPPKPSEPPCPHCDDAYWRYNGSSWYVCDRVTKKRHACATTPVAARAQQAAERERLAEQQQVARARRARSNRRWKAVMYAVAAVIVVAVGFGWYSTRHVYHGPPGGTAECTDGSISYAAHHQGACSWHGGVYAWNR